MKENVFEILKERKKNLKKLIGEAFSYGWIDENRKHELLKKIDSDKLIIGVIGQMKCGKSTFLNSFVFEDTILPSATTPMTAALSVITYGEKERVVAEFYTADEWAEQKLQASRSLDEADGNAAEESKIKAAKELVSKASKLGGSLESLLGKTQEDDFTNLIEYVGADGKYISITKSVTIYYPKEYLKGVEIVDTPGFNDPIVSREERTKDFLKRADVVLMMLYAGRPLDATDRDIIFNNVRQCGIGKVLIGINKYDIPYCSDKNPEDENQIREYVVEEIKKASIECGDNSLMEILRETTPIPLSAEMALLSELPMSKISNDETLLFSWNRHCQNFGISTQKEMRQWSHVDDLTEAVKKLVVKDKENILFSKTINAIIASGSEKITKKESEYQSTKSEVESWSLPDDELEEKERKLNKAYKILDRKISSLGEDIEYQMRNIIRKGKTQLEDDVDSACNRIRSIIENEWGRLTNFDSKIKPKIDKELSALSTRKLPRTIESLACSAKSSIDKCVREFFMDTEIILMKNLPDFDSREFIKEVKRVVEVETPEKDLFRIGNLDIERSDSTLLAFVEGFATGATYGLYGLGKRTVNYNDDKVEILAKLNSISADFDPSPYLNALLDKKDAVISTVKTAFIDNLVEPLKEQITKIRNSKANKEQKLEEAKRRLEDLSKEIQILKEQKEQIDNLKVALG